MFSTEKENDDRIVGNLGLGKRTLSEDKLLMTGLNAFFDFDDHGNIRSSLGVEVRNAVLELTYNQYIILFTVRYPNIFNLCALI